MIDNNEKEDISRKPVRLEDWVTESPNSPERKEACGKGTQLVLFSNGRYYAGIFHCKRWDCPLCAANRIKRIKALILPKCSTWYGAFVEDSELDVVKKRIERADAKYVAVGTQHRWYLLTNKPVIEGSKVRLRELVEEIIEHVLSKYDYTYGERRLRYSDGLFPPNEKELSKGVYSKIVLREAVMQVQIKLYKEGYATSWRKKVDGNGEEKPADMKSDIINGGWFNVLWKE